MGAHGLRSKGDSLSVPGLRGGAGLAALEESAAAAPTALCHHLVDHESDGNETPMPSPLAVAGYHWFEQLHPFHGRAGRIRRGAINPPGVQVIEDMLDRGVIEGIDRTAALDNYIKAAGKVC